MTTMRMLLTQVSAFFLRIFFPSLDVSECSSALICFLPFSCTIVYTDKGADILNELLYVTAYYCMCVLIRPAPRLSHQCPHTTTHVSSY
jgi:hypothetical protein